MRSYGGGGGGQWILTVTEKNETREMVVGKTKKRKAAAFRPSIRICNQKPFEPLVFKTGARKGHER